MQKDKEKQVIRRLVEQQLYLNQQRYKLYEKTGTALTSYSNPAYTVDFIDIACDILGFPIDTAVMQATGRLPGDIPTEKLYSREFLPFIYDPNKDPIDEWLIDKATNALYEKLINDMLNYPELFVNI